ncbi:30S ribosomal protein S2, partial [Flavobacteriaceae bacterium]|nr:30S ribosomal protein S2 [Flavobacteriaceae bacterium]
PGALFVVDIKREHIAIKEAQKLKIPIFAMVDTNSDPREVEYVIPANDDATKSIDKIMSLVVDAVAEGLNERKNEKEALNKEQAESETASESKQAETPAESNVAAPTEEVAAVEESKEEAPEAEAAKDDAATEGSEDN